MIRVREVLSPLSRQLFVRQTLNRTYDERVPPLHEHHVGHSRTEFGQMLGADVIHPCDSRNHEK